MKDTPETPREWLLYALEKYAIAVHEDRGTHLQVDNGYEIEVEQNGMFKLKHAGRVVAPFRDLDELCSFIKLG